MMIHAREDYSQIQDPHKNIPEDEPVFLLRGQDILAPMLVDTWADEMEKMKGDKRLVYLARTHAAEMREWQRERKAKISDL